MQLISSGEVSCWPPQKCCFFRIPDPGTKKAPDLGSHRNVASTSPSNLVYRTVLCFSLFFQLFVLRQFNDLFLPGCHSVLVYITNLRTAVNNLSATGSGVPYFYQNSFFPDTKIPHFGKEKFLSRCVNEVYRNW